MIKKILLAAASLFLIWQSYGILSVIEQLKVDSWWFIVLLAWILNLFITGIFAFAGFAFPTQKLLPKSYYNIYNPKKLKRIYKLFRVEIFRKMLLATLWKSQKQRQKYFNGKKDGIENLETQSMKSEFGHLIPLILLSFLSIYLIGIGLVELGFMTIFINFIGNFYPIILQRHHRMRIQILRKRQQSR